MSGYGRKASVRTVLAATALVLPFAVSGCASQGQAGTVAPNTASGQPNGVAGGQGAGANGGDGAPATSTAGKMINATAGTKLTISNGTSKVLMNGGEVDFGTEVHDLTWSPDGRHAAFVDGDGNLSVSGPDGTGRVVVAKNPGGETWSHPTWQVTAKDPQNPVPARDNLFFVATKGGVSRLMTVPGAAANGTPKELSLGGAFGEHVQPNPLTGNVWPNVGGKVGTAVYENDSSGSPAVYIRDDYLRQQGSKILDNAAQPAYFDDGAGKDEIVFVRSANGHKHIFETSDFGNGTTPHFNDLTPTASADCFAPAISFDGKQVAFATPDQIDIVDVAAPGRVSVVASITGVPAFRP